MFITEERLPWRLAPASQVQGSAGRKRSVHAFAATAFGPALTSVKCTTDGARALPTPLHFADHDPWPTVWLRHKHGEGHDEAPG